MRQGHIFYFYLLIIASAFSPYSAFAKTKVNLVPIHVEPCDLVDCASNFKDYKTLTRYGYSDAMYTLAEMYRIGYGTEIDMRLANKWYRRAAKYDNPYAQYKAAIIYLQESEYQDVDRAMRYLRGANRADLSEATHLLGMLHSEGDLVPQDMEKAKAYLKKSYQADHPDTIQLLSQLSAVQLDIELKSMPAQVKKRSHHTSAIVAPKGEMEVIEVSAPSLEEVFIYHIAMLRKSFPDAGTSTGSMLRGRTCSEIIDCNNQNDRDRIRDFLMSTW